MTENDKTASATSVRSENVTVLDGDAKIRAAAPLPGPPIPAAGMFEVYGACSAVDLDKLPRGLALAVHEFNHLRGLIVEEMTYVVDWLDSVANNRISRPQDQRLVDDADNHLSLLDDLQRTLRIVGPVRLPAKGWDVIVDRAALVRCAVAVGNAYEGATYQGDLPMAHRLHPLAVRFGITDEPRPFVQRDPLDAA